MIEDDEPLPQEPLRALDRARTEFAAHISRDLRTPLVLLLHPLQDILGSPASALAPESRTVLERARRSALRLMSLLESLPNGHTASDGATVAREPADPGAFTASLAGNFRPFCDAAGLRLIVDCPPTSTHADVEPAVWEAIVLNLLANAVTSTTEGTVMVRVRVQDGDLELMVSDTGAGIPAHELPYVFNEREGGAEARPSASVRTRVGLPFVRELVERQNGSIHVHSTSGEGTSVTVRLPLRAQDLPTRAADPGESRPALIPISVAIETVVRPRGRVVIAEDHDETRAFLGEVLEAAGFTVDALADGAAALAACQAWTPDALVSDVLMPGLDGFALIERLRADERTAVIPVLLLSARGGEASRIEGIAAGADDFLVKPLSRRELVARVDGAVRLARLRRDTARREQERIRELSGRLVEVQEAERRKLSAELHDRTSPQLAAIQINLEMLNRLLSTRETEDIRAVLDDTSGLIAETTAGIREISANLRPTVLDDGGLLPALAGYAHQFEQRTGIVVHLHTEDATSVLSPAIQSGLFRIVQEALTNCAKHARARNVTIRLSTDATAPVSLLIADDGIGFDAARQGTSGLGLLTMRERAEFLGGRFSLEAGPGRGTRIQVLI
jgi:signal transduction histidine kinase